MRYDPNEAGLREVLQGPNGLTFRHVTDLARQAKNAAQAEAPVDTGRLRAAHDFTVTVERNQVVGTVGTSVDYGFVVHEGRHINTTVRSGRRAVRVTGRTRGNPWLERAVRRLGLTLRRNGGR